jgi:hypothetical protein
MFTTKILIVLHRKFPVVEHQNLLPIQVNKKLALEKLNIIGDDQGDNISSKNEIFCETTAMYWLWKNPVESDFVGLFHYRRYFVDANASIKSIFYYLKYLAKKIYIKTCPIIFNEFISKRAEYFLSYSSTTKIGEDFNNLYTDLKMEENTIYVARKVFFSFLNVKSQFVYNHIPEDWDIMEEVLMEKYPKYIPALKEVSKRKYLIPYNMFIMSRGNYYNYCTWLFEILFEIECRISISNYPLQRRVIGFLAERLFNIYLCHWNRNKMFKIKYLTVGILR